MIITDKIITLTMDPLITINGACRTGLLLNKKKVMRGKFQLRALDPALKCLSAFNYPKPHKKRDDRSHQPRLIIECS